MICDVKYTDAGPQTETGGSVDRQSKTTWWHQCRTLFLRLSNQCHFWKTQTGNNLKLDAGIQAENDSCVVFRVGIKAC